MIDEKLKVDNMTMEGVADTLLNNGICKSTYAANTTASYCFQWMHGKVFDLTKRSIQTHRARLRRIGIDIARPCDITTFSPVTVTKSQRINIQPLVPPAWYKQPAILPLRAVA